MPYFVCDMDDLREQGKNAGREISDQVQGGLNMLEKEGMILSHVVPQFRTWENKGRGDGDGVSESLFIFTQE
jgi:hypothetical protein